MTDNLKCVCGHWQRGDGPNSGHLPGEPGICTVSLGDEWCPCSGFRAALDEMEASRMTDNLRAHEEALVALGRFMADRRQPVDYETMGSLIAAVVNGIPTVRAALVSRRGGMSAIMDFPTAWAFVRETKPDDHDERCSWRTTHGAFLCDCRVLNDEYERRKSERATTLDLHPEEPALAELQAEQAEDNRIDAWVDRNAPEDFR